MKRSRALYLGIALAAIIIVAFSVVFWWTQINMPKTTFELLPIAVPQWDVGQEKPSTYINVSVKNNGPVDMTGVTLKLSRGNANSSNQIPSQTFWIFTRTFDLMNPGETVTVSTYDHAYANYYKMEISSSEGVMEVFNQWVPWRVTDVPPPP